MTKQEQINLVNGLMDSIHRTICNNIDSGKVPENWDGIELRVYIDDKFNWEGDYIKRRSYRKRRISYNNTILVNNL